MNEVFKVFNPACCNMQFCSRQRHHTAVELAVLYETALRVIPRALLEIQNFGMMCKVPEARDTAMHLCACGFRALHNAANRPRDEYIDVPV